MWGFPSWGMAENPKSCPHPTHTRCSLLRLRPPTPGPPSSAPRPPAAPASATGLCAHKTRPESVFSSETSLGSSSSFILNKRLECGVWQLPPVTATETAPGAAAPRTQGEHLLAPKNPLHLPSSSSPLSKASPYSWKYRLPLDPLDFYFIYFLLSSLRHQGQPRPILALQPSACLNGAWGMLGAQW